MHIPRILTIGAISWLVRSSSGLSINNAGHDIDHRAIRRALGASLAKRDTVLKNTTSIRKSFDGAVLFDATVQFDSTPGQPGVDLSVICTTCYVTAEVTAELVVANVNASGIVSVVEAVAADVANLTATVIDDITAVLANDTVDALELNFDALQWPTVDVDFSLDGLVNDLPDADADADCQISLRLDAFDLYVATATSLSGSATYTLNLYTSETEIGIRVGNDLEVGIVLTVDLIMSVDAAAQIDSGFHLRIDDEFALLIDLFGANVSEIIFNGGTFEFLPLSVDSDVTLGAVLRVSVHAGIILSTGALAIGGVKIPGADYTAGVETVIFADVASLKTTVAASSNGTAASDAGIDDECNGQLAAAEAFAFNLGAGVGANIVVGDVFSWGVNPTTMLPVFYTTVGACALFVSSTPATVTPTGAGRRAAASVSTISTTFTYSAVGCRSTGLLNCPASLQTTAIATAASTTTIAVSSGKEATWPANTATTGVQTKPFGSSAKAMALSVSGAPSSYTPPATSTPASTSMLTATPTSEPFYISGLSARTRNIIIGVSVGVGVGVSLIALVATVIFMSRRRKAVVQQHKGSYSSVMIAEEEIVETRK